MGAFLSCEIISLWESCLLVLITVTSMVKILEKKLGVGAELVRLVHANAVSVRYVQKPSQTVFYLLAIRRIVKKNE